MSAVPVGRRIALTLSLVLVLFLFPAKPSAAPSPAPTSTPAPSPTPIAVTIDKNGFHPQTVRIYSGQYVAWTNDDKKQHTATAADGSWDTGPIDPKQTVVRQFFESGKWDYICGFAPGLQATLFVAPPLPPGVTLPTTAPPTTAPTSTPRISAVSPAATPTSIPAPSDATGG